MNRPPLLSTAGCIALCVFVLLAIPAFVVVYLLAAYVWGAWAGLFLGSIAGCLTVLLLSCVYTGSDGQ